MDRVVPSGAFEAWVQPHLGMLRAQALRLTRNPADAGDLMQDALLRAWLARDQFEPGTNAAAWLRRIVTNTFLNGIRRRRLEQDTLLERAGALEAATMAQAPVDPTAGGMVAQQTSQEVEAALQTINAEYAQVVRLVDLQEQSYRDVAQSLNLPVGTVMSRLHRGRRHLAAALGVPASHMAVRHTRAPAVTPLRKSA